MILVGDIGDYWNDVSPALNQYSKQKRWSNLDSSKKILQDAGVLFEEKANGHIIIHEGDKYDFWATTGLFINRKTKQRGRGVFNLLKKIR